MKRFTHNLNKSIHLAWRLLRAQVVRWKKCYYYEGVRYILTTQGSMVIGSKAVANHILDFELCDHYLYLLSRGGIQRFRCGALWDIAYLDYRAPKPLRSFTVQREGNGRHRVRVYW